MVKRIGVLFLSFWIALFSASCVSIIPERFESSLKFLANYGYVEFNFKGNVLVADLALDVQNKKITQVETDRIMKELEQTILENDKNALGERQFRSLRYMGANRFSAEQMVKSSFVEDLSFFQSENSPFFVEIVTNTANNTRQSEYSIRAFLVDEAMKSKMAQLKVSQHGVFSVETDCRVLQHNAHKVSRSGSNYVYSWNINGRLNTPATLTLRAQNPSLTRF